MRDSEKQVFEGRVYSGGECARCVRNCHLAADLCIFGDANLRRFDEPGAL